MTSKPARPSTHVSRPENAGEASCAAHLFLPRTSVSDVALVRRAKMTFLIAQVGADSTGVPRSGEWELVGEAVCSADALMGRLAAFSRHGQAAIVLELTNAVHQLLDILSRTTLRKRGRQ